MKPEEAIELLRSMQNPKQDYANLVCAPAFCTGYRYVYPEPEDYAIEEAISALKEVQQYREIGTVEECREAREKQTPNKPKDGLYGHGYFACGSCKNPLDGDESYCPQCGQAIRWEN